MFAFNHANSPAAKAHIETQCAMYSDLSKQMFGAMQKIAELNIQVAQTIAEESLSSVQQILSAKDPIEVLSAIAGQAQPTAEKMRAYQQHLSDISAGTQVDLATSAENHIPQTTRTAKELAREVTQRVSEETQKAGERQQAAMEKMKNPINTRSTATSGNAAGNKGTQPNQH